MLTQQKSNLKTKTKKNTYVNFTCSNGFDLSTSILYLSSPTPNITNQYLFWYENKKFKAAPMKMLSYKGYKQPRGCNVSKNVNGRSYQKIPKVS